MIDSLHCADVIHTLSRLSSTTLTADWNVVFVPLGG